MIVRLAVVSVCLAGVVSVCRADSIVVVDSSRSPVLSEVADWGFTIGLAGAGLVFSRSDVWPEVPVIPSPQTDLAYVPEAVPDEALIAGAGIVGAAIALVPVQEGLLSPLAYRNAKGYAQTLALNLFFYSLVKNSVGRKRPSWENFPPDKIRDSRKSFYSGHASTSFAAATYSSLYAINYAGSWENPWHRAGKLAYTGGALAAASWVSYTRVADHRHFVSDVVVGGLAGSGIGILMYYVRNKTLFPCACERNIALDVSPNRIRIAIQW